MGAKLEVNWKVNAEKLLICNWKFYDDKYRSPIVLAKELEKTSSLILPNCRKTAANNFGIIIWSDDNNPHGDHCHKYENYLMIKIKSLKNLWSWFHYNSNILKKSHVRVSRMSEDLCFFINIIIKIIIISIEKPWCDHNLLTIGITCERLKKVRGSWLVQFGELVAVRIAQVTPSTRNISKEEPQKNWMKLLFGVWSPSSAGQHVTSGIGEGEKNERKKNKFKDLIKSEKKSKRRQFRKRSQIEDKKRRKEISLK